MSRASRGSLARWPRLPGRTVSPARGLGAGQGVRHADDVPSLTPVTSTTVSAPLDTSDHVPPHDVWHDLTVPGPPSRGWPREDAANEFGTLASSRQEKAAEYRPRRAMVESTDPVELADPEPAPAPEFQPSASAGVIPYFEWTAPGGPPVVADLASSQRHPDGVSGRLVAGELDRLIAADSRWVCLNSVPGGKKGVEIDHLLIGPGGVFTVNAGRHTPGRVWTGGDIRVGRDEAQRVAQLLTTATRICIRVRGLVVPVNLKKGVVKQPSNIVQIVNHSSLVDYLRSQPPYLDGAARSRISGHARLSSTWSA